MFQISKKFTILPEEMLKHITEPSSFDYTCIHFVCIPKVLQAPDCGFTHVASFNFFPLSLRLYEGCLGTFISTFKHTLKSRSLPASYLEDCNRKIIKVHLQLFVQHQHTSGLTYNLLLETVLLTRCLRAQCSALKAQAIIHCTWIG